MIKYISVDELIYHSESITETTKKIYHILETFSIGKVSCFPGIETIAEKCGKSLSTVKTAIKELRRVGLIRIYVTTHNNYLLIPPEWVKKNLMFKRNDVPESEQYITNVIEFQRQADEIEEYLFINLGLDIEVVKKEKTNKTTLRATIKEKLATGNHDLNVNEFVLYTEELYTKTTGHLMNNSYGYDNEKVGDFLAVNGYERTFEILTTFATDYDTFHSQSAYKVPRLRQLSWSSYMNPIIKRTDRRLNERKIDDTIEETAF